VICPAGSHAPGSKPVKAKKVRLDELLVSRGIAQDAKAAAAIIMAGDVFLQQVSQHNMCAHEHFYHRLQDTGNLIMCRTCFECRALDMYMYIYTCMLCTDE
jgi:hypothetical protein